MAGGDVPEWITALADGDKSHWTKAWDTGRTPWHNSEVVGALQKYIEQLTGGNKQARVLLPLCGKSLDMKWLADEGYSVVGVELVETAAKLYFEENNIKYTKEKINDDIIIYEGVDVKIRYIVGDFLSCTSEICGGQVDAIWDINALVAIPMNSWNSYVDTCVSLLKPTKRLLLSTIVYDEAERASKPIMPYSVPAEKIQKLYGDRFDVQHLEDTDFLYFIKPQAALLNWNPTKCDQCIHLLTLKK